VDLTFVIQFRRNAR